MQWQQHRSHTSKKCAQRYALQCGARDTTDQSTRSTRFETSLALETSLLVHCRYADVVVDSVMMMTWLLSTAQANAMLNLLLHQASEVSLLATPFLSVPSRVSQHAVPIQCLL